jgi:hypothetical protein
MDNPKRDFSLYPRARRALDLSIFDDIADQRRRHRMAHIKTAVPYYLSLSTFRTASRNRKIRTALAKVWVVEISDTRYGTMGVSPVSGASPYKQP